MGIRHLYQWMTWITGTACSHESWAALEGRKVGVDALSIIYRARGEGGNVLEILAAIIRQLKSRNIEPVFVFDGKSPTEKDGTRYARRRQKERLDDDGQERARVSVDDRNRIKQLFYALGVLFLNARQEADTLLAFLARRGDIAAVITYDLDFLPRGCQHVIVPDNLLTTCISRWKSIHLPHLLQSAQLSYDQFVDMCVIMGCDYAPSIPTVSYQTAYWLIRGGVSLLTILEGEGIRNPTAWIHACSMLRGEGDMWETVMSEQQREKWEAGAPPAEPDAEVLRKLVGQ